MPFSGEEVSEKGFPRGWDADADDLASQRVFRVTQLLEAMVFRPFAWDRFNSLDLRYSYHGGYIDNGVDAWVLIPDSADEENGGTSVTLVDGETNFIERSDIGNVVVNTEGFTHDGFIPMAQIAARNGAFVGSTYIDSRPEIGGAPVSGGEGAITFPEIVGVILGSQVPLEVVKQWEGELVINAAQITPGTFGILGLLLDYTFPRDLTITQDLFVGRDLMVDQDLFVDRDAMIDGDLAVMENANILGIFTAEGVAIFEALATFQAAVVMESTLNVEGVFTAEAQAVFEAAALFLDTVNVEGVTTLENQTRRGIRTITAADTPYTLVATDWHLNVDISLGSVEVLVPDAAAHFAAGFTDQLHFKIIGSGFGDPFVTLTPSVLGQEIDGFEAAILRRNNRSFTLVSDGAGWFIQ